MKASPSTRSSHKQITHTPPSATQRLVRFYLTGLGIIAMVAVLGLAWNQAALRRQAQGARMLALAGRQRVLGQQIALDALAVQAADTPDVRQARAETLEQAADEWEKNQATLSGLVSPAVARLLGNAVTPGREALTDARGLLAALPPDGSPQKPDLCQYLTPLLHSEALYAPGMDAVVAESDHEAHGRAASLARTAWGLLVLTLLTLGAEAALVFGPSWGVVRRTVVSLQEAEDKITGLDAALGEADRQIGEMRTVLENLSTVDALTGLKNHREFHEQLDRELGRALRHGHALSLMLVDVDKFKSYNDTYGHPDGDEALKLIARALKENARGSDIPARYGGEEFAVILTETDAMGALVLGERMRHAVADGDCLQRPLTVSVGIATLTPNMFGVAELIAQADRALCHAKGEGRNRVTHASRLPEPVEENWRFLPDGELVAA